MCWQDAGSTLTTHLRQERFDHAVDGVRVGFDEGGHADGFEGFGCFGADADGLHRVLLEGFFEPKSSVEIFRGGAAGEGDPVRARFFQSRDGAGAVFGFGDGFVNGDVIDDGA